MNDRPAFFRILRSAKGSDKTLEAKPLYLLTDMRFLRVLKHLSTRPPSVLQASSFLLKRAAWVGPSLRTSNEHVIIARSVSKRDHPGYPVTTPLKGFPPSPHILQ
ncbi:MAG: hypothetical protein EWM73_03271 [Nitrospira sp.]|nr:MAG: hypothetical protein EWM73_03271 [Nitrospira sp.]